MTSSVELLHRRFVGVQQCALLEHFRHVIDQRLPAYPELTDPLRQCRTGNRHAMAGTAAARTVSQLRQVDCGLRMDMAMDKETRRFDVELLADALTDVDQRLATVATATGLGLVAMFSTRQFRG